MLEKNDSSLGSVKNFYKGFDLICSKQVPDCNSTVFYLRHRKTGLEVFHLLNDDEENLFAFSFRTPVKNSTGAAHILEHSVFCGSQKFPLKEPFTNLMNQSVNTFLNALTYTDKTVYPASSLVKSDYFNLMDVYADAVFFPLLKKEAFMQEAHRVELDENGNACIQGVVYNEMKGNYSSFDSVANDIQFNCLLQDSAYSYDSGGDPLEIPSFTYEDFRAFHKKYYRPDNCLLFLYGNIPTKTQLDFIQEKFLDRLEKQFFYSEDEWKILKNQIDEAEKIKKIKNPLFIKKIAPDIGAAGSSVSISWLCGETKNFEQAMEMTFLEEVLCGHDGSLLNKALSESGYGDDVISGVISESRYLTYSLGLHSVEEKDVKKVFDLVLDTLKKVAEGGVQKSDIDSAVLAAEFSNREVYRVNGPYSLILLDRVLSSWNYYGDPWTYLYLNDGFSKIKKNAESDPEYIQKLVKKYLLDNKKMAFVQVEPSSSFLELRKQKESELIEKIKINLDIEKTKEDLSILHQYQQHRETLEEVACIPALKLSDLKIQCEKIEMEFSFCDFKESSEQDKKNQNENIKKILLLKNIEKTNGVVYLNVAFPLDFVPENYYKFIPSFLKCVSSTGWNGKSWTECSDIANVCSGGFFSKVMTGAFVDTPSSIKKMESMSRYNIANRDYLIFRTKFLTEDADKALENFGDYITGYEFLDEKHGKILLEELRNDMKASVIPHGNRYASRRAQCHLDHSAILDEIWKGFSQIYTMDEIVQKDFAQIRDIFMEIKSSLSATGGFIHVCCDEKSITEIEPKLLCFAEKNNFFAPLPKNTVDESILLKQTYLPDQVAVEFNECFNISSQVGYVSSYMNGIKYGTKEFSSANVLAHWLCGTFLWEKIRTTGGAYGANAGCNPASSSFYFSTYRDPNPQKSMQLFLQILKEASQADLSDEEVVRLVTGTYGDVVQPMSACQKANLSLYRTIFCRTDEDRLSFIKGIVQTSKSDILNVAKKLFENPGKIRSALLCENPEKNAGAIINLPL